MKHLHACFIVLSYSTFGLIACSPPGSPEAIKGTTGHNTAESLANEVPAKDYHGELARMQYLADQQ